MSILPPRRLDSIQCFVYIECRRITGVKCMIIAHDKILMFDFMLCNGYSMAMNISVLNGLRLF